MWNLNDVIALRYLGNYSYHITFDDGLAGDVDFTEYLDRGPVFRPLKAPEVFRQARIEGGTIA